MKHPTKLYNSQVCINFSQIHWSAIWRWAPQLKSMSPNPVQIKESGEISIGTVQYMTPESWDNQPNWHNTMNTFDQNSGANWENYVTIADWNFLYCNTLTTILTEFKSMRDWNLSSGELLKYKIECQKTSNQLIQFTHTNQGPIRNSRNNSRNRKKTDAHHSWYQSRSDVMAITELTCH